MKEDREVSVEKGVIEKKESTKSKKLLWVKVFC